MQYGAYATPRLDLGVALWEYSLAQNLFIGAKVLPLFGTPKKAATYSAITRESILRRADVKRAPKGPFNRDEFNAKDKTYNCVEYGHEQPVDVAERELYSSDFDLERSASEIAMRRILQEQEIRVAGKVFNTGTWAGADLFTDNKATPWSTAATDILAQVLAAKEKVRKLTGLDPNTLIISKATLVNVLKNTNVKDAIKYVQIATVPNILAALAGYFGVEKMVVGGGVYNTAKEGQAFSGSDIWSNKYAMVALTGNPGDSLETPSVGRTFQWTAMTPDTGGVVSEQYIEPQTDSLIIRVRQHVDENVIDSSFAHLIQIEV